MRGFDVRINEIGLAAVRLHYSADPEKDPTTEQGQKWVDNMRRFYPDPNQWNQEFEINFWVAAGTRVYPEFNEIHHCRDVEHRSRKVIYRAWDFGWITPACVIAQIDERDRLVILRELVGREQTTKSFAEDVIFRCAQWYPHHVAGFQDFCDPAGQQHKPNANERSEAQDVAILQTLGVYPTWEHGWSRKDGRSLVHQLLQLRVDDTPSLYVNPTRCPVLVQGFLGKFVYPGTRDGRAKDEPDESLHPWADVQACLRYLATGLYSALGLRRSKAPVPTRSANLKYSGYGTPIRRSERVMT